MQWGSVMCHQVTLDVVLGRMPADPCPTSSCFDDDRVIQVQGNDRGPSCWSQADDMAAILAPAKVLTPKLLARVEQRYTFACEWVVSRYLRALEFVAGVAGDAQVFPHRLAASSFRDDMVDHQTGSGDRRQGMTIRTLVTACGDHALAQSPRDTPSGHPKLRSSSGEGI